MIRSPGQYDIEERTKIIARFFHDGRTVKEQASRFFSGEEGHDYNNHRHHFWGLMCKLDNRYVPEDELLGLIPEIAGETLAVVSSVPVTLDAAIHDARTPFSTYALVKDLCSTAQKEVVWTDRYFDQSLFHRYFRDTSASVWITLVTWPAAKTTGRHDQARVGDFMDVSRLFAQERGPQRYRLVTSIPFANRTTSQEGTPVIRVDIAADLNEEDESGFVWTFLDEARDPALIVPGAIIVAGDPDAPAVAEVVDVVDKPAGTIVHLRLLPGSIEDYEALVRRALTPA